MCSVDRGEQVYIGLHSLVEKPLEKYPLERRTTRYENNMKMGFRNAGCKGVR
jgi:hypothetical protein